MPKSYRAAILLIIIGGLPVLLGAVAAAADPSLVLQHGVLIDVTDFGNSGRDIPDAAVVITGGVITAAGPTDQIAVPDGAEVIDCTGQYLVPGLIDGFTALNHQGQANACLACGVTSILGVESTRRGPLALDCDPSPRVHLLGEAGYEAAPLDDLLRQVETAHDLGADVVLLMYRITPEQMGPVVDRVHALGMACIGELAATTYAEAARLGVDAFVHSSRYNLDLAPDDLRRGVLAEPFSDDLGSAKWRYYRKLGDYAQDAARVDRYSRVLAASGVALMPTFSLGYLDRPDHSNPWNDPVAGILDPRDINRPADPATGNHEQDPAHARAYADLIAAEMALDRSHAAAGAHYLAASGADVWGTMPGISLHHELAALAEIGLTPRQVLAAATWNFSAVFGWEDAGLIAPGRRADILVLGADPRADITALRDIRREYLAGRPVDLDALLQPVVPRDGRLLARDDFTVPADLLDANGRALPAYAWLDSVTINRITYASDGLRVTGHLVTPRAPGPHPCLIYNRGGNRDFGANSPRRVALRLARFASWGYTVIATQYRGVDGGEGVEEFGGAEIDDVLNLIPVLAGLPAEADTSRIGMVGFSRGGMTTYLALARTCRIKGAAVVGGVSDAFATISARPDMETYVYAELLPGYPARKEAALKARSPVLWPEKLCPTTPLLLLHGASDWRVGVDQSIRMAEGLLRVKHPVRLVVFEGADHGLTEFRPEAYGMIRSWLDRYVRDGEPWPSLEPHGD